MYVIVKEGESLKTVLTMSYIFGRVFSDMSEAFKALSEMRKTAEDPHYKLVMVTTAFTTRDMETIKGKVERHG